MSGRYRALAVSVLWSHLAPQERDRELEDVEELVSHVERCLRDATKALAERAALWTSELGNDPAVPRQAELYRAVWKAAIERRDEP